MLHFQKPQTHWFVQQGLFLAHGTCPCQVGFTLRATLTEHPQMSLFLTMYCRELVIYNSELQGSQKVLSYHLP